MHLNDMLFGRGIHQRKNPWDDAPPWAIELGAIMFIILKQQERRFMATQAELDRLNAAVTADTNAVSAATKALTGFQATVADLTQKLQDAIASGDSAAITKAADDLEANNAALAAATPATAAAIVAGTPAA